eukprot:CAMPEP_0184311534 /NCGR_PEP_ID=MMETSP1049-20130417/42239_1 /TAXON_ID=77928 /ORGANISM="Proteomonas sulcata, Strain CCMP704" /LENGTH=112 /DNA_ID=CAMNT_0026626987 /DNA_START=233 /DNA_END=569 /DNA_ORIENTATION=+
MEELAKHGVPRIDGGMLPALELRKWGMEKIARSNASHPTAGGNSTISEANLGRRGKVVREPIIFSPNPASRAVTRVQWEKELIESGLMDPKYKELIPELDQTLSRMKLNSDE